MKKATIQKIGLPAQRLINSFAEFNTELDQHIGKLVKYKKPSCILEKENFKIRHIQHNYQGKLCFNLIAVTENQMGEGYINSLSNSFGRACDINDVYFI